MGEHSSPFGGARPGGSSPDRLEVADLPFLVSLRLRRSDEREVAADYLGDVYGRPGAAALLREHADLGAIGPMWGQRWRASWRDALRGRHSWTKIDSWGRRWIKKWVRDRGHLLIELRLRAPATGRPRRVLTIDGQIIESSSMGPKAKARLVTQLTTLPQQTECVCWDEPTTEETCDGCGLPVPAGRRRGEIRVWPLPEAS
ncbi:MAG: hypothetical protein AAF211_22305 [Myxococcota bacterium]